MTFYQILLCAIFSLTLIVNEFAWADDDTETREQEIAELRRLVNSTNNLKTWYSITHNGVLRDSTEEFKRSPLPEGVQDKELFDLNRTINSRVYDLECTYAYYALRHLNLVYSFVDHMLVIDLNALQFIVEIQELYGTMAYYTIASIFNLNHIPPIWMYQLISHLVESSRVRFLKFPEELAKMIKVLIEVTSTEPCNVKFLPSVPLETFESLDVEELPWHNYVGHINQMNDTDPFTWTYIHRRNVIFTKYYSSEKKYYDGDFLSTCFDGKFMVRVSDMFIFDFVKTIMTSMNRNILDVEYILYQNQHATPYLNYKDCFVSQLNEAREVQEIKEHENMVAKFKSPEDDFYAEEINEMAVLRNKICPLMGTSVSFSYNTASNLFSLLSYYEEIKTIEIFDFMEITRDEFSTLSILMNSVTSDIHCAYGHYIRVHLNRVQQIMKIDSLDHKEFHQDDLKLVYKFINPLLMMIASLINNKYQSPDWMLKVLLYLQHLKAVKENDITQLLEENIEILNVVNDGISSCDENTLPKEILMINNKSLNVYENLSDIELKSFYVLEPRIIECKTRGEYITSISDNTTQAKRFLEYNKNNLSYKNFDEFQPSKWLFSKNILTVDVVKSLLWDRTQTNENAGNDEYWRRVTDQMFTGLGEGTDVLTKINNSNLIHDRVINLLRATMIWYLLSSMTLWSFTINSLNKVSVHNKHPDIYNDFEHYCIEIKKSIENIIKFSGLKQDILLSDLLNEMNSENMKSDVFVSKNFRLGIKELNRHMTNMRIHSNVPILPVWTSKTVLTSDGSLNEDTMKRIKELHETISKYGSTFRENFKDMNFHVYKSLFSSYGNKKLHYQYAEEYNFYAEKTNDIE